MSAIRTSVFRAAAAATRPATLAARPLSTSARLLRREVIAEKQIPVSSYADESHTPQRSSIPVRNDPEIESHAEETAGLRAPPLTKALFSKLPKSIQRQTVMDKVVIVTG